MITFCLSSVCLFVLVHVLLFQVGHAITFCKSIFCLYQKYNFQHLPKLTDQASLSDHISFEIGNLFIPLVMFCFMRVFIYIIHHADEQRRFSSIQVI